MFDEVITDRYLLAHKCIIRDGFVFVSVTKPSNIYDGLLIKVGCENNRNSFPHLKSDKTLQEHIEYFNAYELEKACIHTDNIGILSELKTLKHLSLVLDEKKQIDFTPLYNVQNLRSLSITTSNFESLSNPIDCSKFKALEFFSANGQDVINMSSLPSIKTLLISNDCSNNLYKVFSNEDLDTLMMMKCKISSLNGIEQSKNMQCLYLYHNRCLEDIRALRGVKYTLRALQIENCSRIKDFSVISELENLEHLMLCGSNVLESLSFLENLKNLKTLILDFNVLDGDLSFCQKLSYVYIVRNRKHYNIKDKELPKGTYYRGNENIDLWRRYG